MESKCLWLVYSSYHLLNFTFSHLTVWTARPTLRAVLQKTDCLQLMETANKCCCCCCCCCCCFEYPLKFLLKSSYQKCLYKFLFAKFSYPQRNPVMTILKTKKKSLYHLGNFNSPLPLQPPPSAGPKVKRYCLRCSDQCRWSVSFKQINKRAHSTWA